MSAVPQGAFAAVKVKQFLGNQKEERRSMFRKKFFPIGTAMEQPLFNYSSKLMNSIWGFYNQYSVHNLKKNTDGGVFYNQCM